MCKQNIYLFHYKRIGRKVKRVGKKFLKINIFDVDRGVDNVDNFVDKMWISVGIV